MTNRLTIHTGDWIQQLHTMPDNSIHCVVTSPPYWALRDYQVNPQSFPRITYVPMAGCKPITVAAWTGCLGLEPTPEMFIAHIVHGFREVRRVLRDDGTLWVSFGDSYASNGGHSDSNCNDRRGGYNIANRPEHEYRALRARGSLKPKDMVGTPWRVAFALQADGWYLRMDNVWQKPNPMPESVTDRPTKAHEYIFLLAKSDSYFYDAEAIKEQSSPGTHARLSQATLQTQMGGSKQEAYRDNTKVGKKSRDRTPAEILKATGRKLAQPGSGVKNNDSMDAALAVMPLTRNKRSVWTITTKPYSGAHFATFPPELPKICILAGTSAYGCCATCSAPWERVTYRDPNQDASWNGSRFDDGKNLEVHPNVGKRPPISGKHAEAHKSNGQRRLAEAREAMRAKTGQHDGYFTPPKTAGWQPTCECHGKFVRGKVTIPARLAKEHVTAWGADTNGEYLGQSTKDHADHGIQDASAVKARIIENATTDREVEDWIYQPAIPLNQHPVKPCTVLDPFGGSGTTGAIAIELGRHAILIELNPEYVTLIQQRTNVITPGLPL